MSNAGRPTSEINQDLARLAADLHARRNVSAAELVRATGYLQRSESVTIEAIRAELRSHPDWVEAWLTYSGDKRTDSGWYITQDGAGRCLVGYYPGPEPEPLNDCIHACAMFVHREVTDIAARMLRSR